MVPASPSAPFLLLIDHQEPVSGSHVKPLNSNWLATESSACEQMSQRIFSLTFKVPGLPHKIQAITKTRMHENGRLQSVWWTGSAYAEHHQKRLVHVSVPKAHEHDQLDGPYTMSLHNEFVLIIIQLTAQTKTCHFNAKENTWMQKLHDI